MKGWRRLRERHKWNAKPNHHSRRHSRSEANTGEAVRVAHEKRMTELSKKLRSRNRAKQDKEWIEQSAAMTASGLFEDDVDADDSPKVSFSGVDGGSISQGE